MRYMPLPRSSFARTVVSLRGYNTEQMIGEVASVDGVDRDEARRRVMLALEQQRNRSVAQAVRHSKRRARFELALRQALSIALHRGRFLCAQDMASIGAELGWSAPGAGDALWDTGRVFREVCCPLERAGLFAELRDEDERFIGYTLTDAGRRAYASDEAVRI